MALESSSIDDQVETVMMSSSKTIHVENSRISLNHHGEVDESRSITPTKVNSLLVAAEDVEGEESGAADEEYSNECSNYTDEEEEGASQDGNDVDKDGNIDSLNHKRHNSDTKTNGSIGEGLNAAAIKFLEERKEVTYSAYGINLENSIKLLSCSKNVNMVCKRDIKAKRMFVTSFSSIKE